MNEWMNERMSEFGKILLESMKIRDYGYLFTSKRAFILSLKNVFFARKKVVQIKVL